ncbi:hypothetical protein KI387_012579 [Taxus chinensis]|uniref:Bromo domain-containing protein n=1 Tax=Taxus chinensis TaxID=29808 RepID=A0AA38CGK4_TAXCH|nr:hypothetical protein KI387_012579 [Taxus chinensis]
MNGGKMQGVFKGCHNFDRIGPAIKYKCMALLQSIINHPQAWPFMEPFDPKVWDAPKYRDVISEAMNLGRIRSKLRNNQYSHPVEFVQEIELTFENAMRYNPQTNSYHKMAKNVLQHFYSQWKPIGIEIARTINQETLSGQKALSSVKPKSLKFISAQSMASMNSTAEWKHESHTSGHGLLRDSKKGDIFNPITKDFCITLLHSLINHPQCWPFMEPLDSSKWNAPYYHTVILNPMDLGTVRSKLGDNKYSGPREFADDVELVFNNAIKYNPSGSEYHRVAENLLEHFQFQWKFIVTEIEKEVKKKDGHVVGIIMPSHRVFNADLSGSDEENAENATDLQGGRDHFNENGEDEWKNSEGEGDISPLSSSSNDDEGFEDQNHESDEFAEDEEEMDNHIYLNL